MSRYKDKLYELEIDAIDMSKEEFIKKHGELYLDIWEDVQRYLQFTKRISFGIHRLLKCFSLEIRFISDLARNLFLCLCFRGYYFYHCWVSMD